MDIDRAVGVLRNIRKLRANRILGIAFTVFMLYGWRAPASTSQVVGWGYNSQWQTILPSDTTNVVAIAAGLDHTLIVFNNGKVQAFGGGAEGLVPAGLAGVKAIAAAEQQSLALRTNGQVVAWGQITNVPANATNVVAIATGGSHNLALRGDGTVVAWGMNYQGQTDVPAGLTNVVAIGAKMSRSFAVLGDGRVISWGYDNYGQDRIPSDWTNIAAVAASRVELALRHEGEVATWGEAIPVPFGRVLSVAAGNGHRLALLPDGTVSAWGANGAGQGTVPGGLSNVVAIAAGMYNSLALIGGGRPFLTTTPVDRTVLYGSTTSIRVEATGEFPLQYQWTRDGEPMPGATDSQLIFTNIQMSQTGVYAVRVTNRLGSVVSRDVRLYVSPARFQSEPKSQVSFPGGTVVFRTTPAGQGPFTYQWLFNGQEIAGATSSSFLLENVQSAQAGTYAVRVTNGSGTMTSAGARLSLSEVVGWGNNPCGEAEALPDLTNVVMLAAGLNHNLALLDTGSVVGWGLNGSGQVSIPAGLTNAMAVAAGGYHSMALRSNGTVLAWGFNTAGQANVPAGLENVKAIAAGYQHSVALLASGRVAAWGDNTYWQLNVPGDLTNATAIASSGNHTLALTRDGRVVAWGDNKYGQCTMPALLTNVIRIGAAYNHSLAIKSDGTLVAWGSNDSGQRNVPAGLTNVAAAMGGYYHTAVLTDEGRVVNFGGSFPGQPTMPTNLPPVKAIAAAYNHTLALVGYPPPARPPVITGQPQNLSIMDGDSATFEVAASGHGLLSYQWEFNGNGIAGATDSRLVLQNVTTNAQGQYRVWVSDEVGAVLSDAAILNVQPPSPPVITRQPFNLSVMEGDSATFEVAASGHGLLSYQWQFNGNDIAEATDSRLVLQNVATNAQGQYRASVSNELGAVLSDAATLTVEPWLPPVIVTQPDSTNAYGGETVMFRVVVTGQGPFDFEWEFNGEPLTGATNAMLTVSNISARSAGTYLVSVRNRGGEVRSSAASLTVLTSDGVVREPTESALRAAIRGYRNVRFACDGTITLQATIAFTRDTVVDGAGHYIAISGSDAVRVFEVAPQVAMTLANLTVCNGRTNAGAGILNRGGNVTITNCTFENNFAVGTNGGAAITNGYPGGSAQGGAIFNAGDLWITNSTFSNNQAIGGPGGNGMFGGNGGHSEGGALCTTEAMWVWNTTFTHNVASGGKGGIGGGSQYSGSGAGGDADAGAISSAGTATIISCVFVLNRADGGAAGSTENVPARYGQALSAGHGQGGALNNSGNVLLTNCVFISNSTSGGTPGSAFYGWRGANAFGGAICNSGVLTADSGCQFSRNAATAGKGGGFKNILDGRSFGGGIYNNGTLQIADAECSSNRVSYGEAAGGGLYSAAGSVEISGSRFAFNTAESGTAGDWYYGGSGFHCSGGAVFTRADSSFTQCLFASNSVVSGPATYGNGGTGGQVGNSGNGYGGGIASRGQLSVNRCTFLGNSVSGAVGVFGRTYGMPLTTQGGGAAGGGIATMGGTASILNTIFYNCVVNGGQGSSVPNVSPYNGDGGSGGWAFGAGVYVTNAFVGFTNCTLTMNFATPGDGGSAIIGRAGPLGTSAGGGIYVQDGATSILENIIACSNGTGEVAGIFTGTHNLIGIDARLGPLTTNTQGAVFLPLLPDSPAIDGALPERGVDVDVRRVTRPFGNAPDIGAYEWNGTDTFWLSFPVMSNDQHTCVLKGAGPANQQFRVQVSTDLVQWMDTVTSSTGSDGRFSVLVPGIVSDPMRFYRVILH